MLTIPHFTHHRFLAGVLAIAALGLSFWPAAQRVEDMAYAVVAGLWSPGPATGATRVAVIAIDAQSLGDVAPWPWPRAYVADLVDKTSAAGAAAIGVLLPLDEPYPVPDVVPMRQAVEEMDAQGRARWAAWMDRLDGDAALAQALAGAGNVILAAPYARDGRGPGADALAQSVMSASAPTAHAYLQPTSLLLQRPVPTVTYLQAPLRAFRQAAAGVGVVAVPSLAPYEPLALAAGEGYLPSFALSLAAVGRSLVIYEGEAVRVGTARYDTDSALGLYLRPTERAPEVYSAAALWAGQVPAPALRGKTVLIGATAPAAGDSGLVMQTARAVEALLSGQTVYTPYWGHGLQRLVIVLLGVYWLFLPLRLRGALGLGVAAGVAALLFNISVLGLVLRGVWLPLALPALLLLSVQGVLAARQRAVRVLDTLTRERSEALRELAQQLQGQGQLDAAFVRLRQCALDDTVLEPLYQLGLEFERRRQFSKAAAVYQYVADYRSGYRDVRERLARHTAPVEPVRIAAAGGAVTTLVVDAAKVALPVLGRYRVECELGRGAMGTVYRAIDPKIGRVVAIKTLPLTEEFAGDRLAEVKRRFFQEAEAAGRLNHPNIVTIYDVGEEHDLAFIAMDYVDGEGLDVYTQRDNLLTLGEVLHIGATVADALDYAHRHDVVHRDVKPANIIYQRQSRALKMTDFGIALLMDESKTRTGTILGSPAYMSPEQIAGARVDGRSDVYSLGVTLYQLLTGALPFAGESLASLTHKISTGKPTPLRKQRGDLPACITRIVNKALEKDPDQRYLSGAAMAEALRRCAVSEGVEQKE